MITEFALAGGLVYGYNYLTSSKRKIKKVINDIFKNNNFDYRIENIVKTNAGFDVIINLYGVGYEHLENCIDLLESSLGYRVFIEKNKNLKTATISIITQELDDSVEFNPVKIKPHEVYIGLDYKIEKIIVDLNKFPHVLVSGQTGTGKSILINLILANKVYVNSSRDISLYFANLSDTNDFNCFKNIKHTKGFVTSIQDSIHMFKRLKYIYTKRLSIFGKQNCNDIVEYNTKNFNKRMCYIYIIIDEFADFFPSSQLEKDYKLKVQCYNYIKDLIRKARKVGIFFIIGIQRPDTTVLDPNLKSNICTKIGFSQNNDASSLVVADTTELTNIENRKALLMYGNKRIWFRSIYFTKVIQENYLKKIIINNNELNSFVSKYKENKQVTIAEIKKKTKKEKVFNNYKIKLR